MHNIHINEDSKIDLHRIEIYPVDDESVTVRRIGTSDYLSFDVNALKIYQSFSSEKKIGDIISLTKEYEYSLSDIIEFVEVLINAGYVKSIDGVEITESLTDQQQNQNIKSNKLIQFLFSKVGWIIYFLSMVVNLFLFYYFEDLRPKGSDFFVSNSGIVSIFVIIISTWIAIFFHEFGHICAANSVGISAKVRWGYRLVFLVLETNVKDIWSVSRKKRYGVYLAGLAWTSVLVMFCSLIQFWVSNEIIIKVFKFTVILQLQTIVFQSLLFLRTDLYYVITNFLKVDNLNEQAIHLIKNILTFRFNNINKSMEETSIKEKRIVIIYSLFSFFGCLISLYLFFVIDVPIALHSVTQTLEKTLSDPLFSFSYWDGIAMGTLTLCPIVILSVYSLLDLKKRINEKKKDIGTIVKNAKVI